MEQMKGMEQMMDGNIEESQPEAAEFSFEKAADDLAEARTLIDRLGLRASGAEEADNGIVSINAPIIKLLAEKRRALEGYESMVTAAAEEEDNLVLGKRLRAAKYDLLSAIREIDSVIGKEENNQN